MTKIFEPKKVLLDWKRVRLIKENLFLVGNLKDYLQRNHRETIAKTIEHMEDTDAIYYAEYHNLWCVALKPDLCMSIDEIRKCPDCSKVVLSSFVNKYNILRCPECYFCVVVDIYKETWRGKI